MHTSKNTQTMVRANEGERPAIPFDYIERVRVSHSLVHPHRVSREDAEPRMPEIRGMWGRFFSEGHERASEGGDDAYGNATGFEADSATGTGAKWVGAATARTRRSGPTGRTTCRSASSSAGRATSSSTSCTSSASSAASRTTSSAARARELWSRGKFHERLATTRRGEARLGLTDKSPSQASFQLLMADSAETSTEGSAETRQLMHCSNWLPILSVHMQLRLAPQFWSRMLKSRGLREA